MAVYTDVSDEELRGFLGRYALGTLVFFTGIAEGVENSNFLVRTTLGSYILTLYEARVAAPDLPFFIALMQHLAQRGIACPTPIADRDGVVLQTLRERPAAIVSFLEGVWPRRPTPAHCAAVGTALAHLHVAGGDFPQTRNNALSLPGWQDLAGRIAARADSVQPGLAGTIDATLGALSAAWPCGLPTGVIHADLFPDNVFFLGPAISGIIDFYFACTDALAYDLAICLNAWCFEADGSYNVTAGRILIAHYQAVRQLNAAERDALPQLARGAALRFLLTRLYDWLNRQPGALVRPKNPRDYAVRLGFHNHARRFEDYTG